MISFTTVAHIFWLYLYKFLPCKFNASRIKPCESKWGENVNGHTAVTAVRRQGKSYLWPRN